MIPSELNKSSVHKIKEKIKKLALKTSADFEEVFTLFVIERAVVRLMTNEKLARSMIFKGGFVCVRVFESPRYTIDLDSVLHGCLFEEAKTLILEVVQQDHNDGIWFQFESSEILKTQSEYGGLRLQFRVGFYPALNDIRRAKILHIDLGTGDPVTPMATKLKSVSLFGTEEISWSVYPVETICAEKIHPIVVLGSDNSRSKDVFDLSFLLHRCDVETLKRALSKTFEYRKTELPSSLFAYFNSVDTKVFRKGWSAATREIKPIPPHFDKCWDIVISFLQKEGL
jgi:hypothetical protein